MYRISLLKEAGFDAWPTDFDGMLKVAQALAAKGKPGGLALGNAVGDGNTWCHWLVWSFGGRMVDEKDQVVINSPETIAALEYAKELYKSLCPGTLSWLDPSNNKAFLDGQISWTINGISIYYSAKNSKDEKIKALADDIGHAILPSRTGRASNRVAPDRAGNGVRLYEIPECRQGLYPLHARKGAVCAVAGGVDRLFQPALARL